jgi:acetylglutamate kinase
VIYPIGKDEKGNKLNVNADTMAAGIAAGIGCEELIMITDVPGILLDVKDPSSLVNKLTLKEVDELISNGTISGGMIPKVDACRSALEAGAKTVRMVNGKDPRSILTDLMKNVPHGTIITK